jgi:hypothetical protein
LVQQERVMMSESKWDDFIASARALALPVDPSCHPAERTNLEVT